MKCQWCGGEFPKRTGRFCGTCQKPKTTISINKQSLFILMHSHSRLSQAEYERNPAYNDSHFSAVAEKEIIDQLNGEQINEYFDYVEENI